MGVLIDFFFFFFSSFFSIPDSRGWENRPHILIGADAKLYYKGPGQSDEWRIVTIFVLLLPRVSY